ncbi:VOC family protein [Desmospora profundinema]|uniref:PhnB protein n=1 Tax=Desmospora profundinema TaxID=1571184 RepID=A0ABU1IJX4_9BACL|nr:VOC family protein [Desmospora profundinema]MDR6225071.1 PhnB protein [Desmospora profundinema]
MIVGINPFLVLDGDGQKAVRFYEQALDATVLSVQTFAEMPENPEFRIPDDAKDRVLHAHLKVGNTDLMISDTCPQRQTYSIGSQVTIAITISDLEKSKQVFNRLKEGGQVVMSLQETFWSPLYGQVTDKFGVTWHVSTHVTDS